MKGDSRQVTVQRNSWTHWSKPANKNACSTAYDGGQLPSAPQAPGSSNRERATARAAVHDKSEPHLKRHACSARFLNKSFRALARTSNLMKICVSTDHLPPTSKDNQPRTAPWTNKFRVPTFLPPACDGQSRSILLNRASPGLTIGMESTHEGRVDC